MTVTLQDAVDHLYRLTVVQKQRTSTKRLSVLGGYCVEQLAARGLRGATQEEEIAGGGRPKSWDVAWEYDGKFRLGISLKSLLKNLRGTVPNRIDDLMGETANAQLHSPEIVLGYVMILDISTDTFSKKHISTWSDLLRSRLSTLSGRRAPSWTVGTIEAFVLVEVDFRQSSRVLSGTEAFAPFFDTLVEQVRLRNPNALPNE